ncbi:hypothetical protein X777_16943 [Ooceraea biroi]|uniref:Uncharacterized protein n=1 Tax=Ooceraea biroi TaxID=2015173 RepID=A0A026WSM4_OOCBI|nr:hypothetical protein X777_16943 [Ooceraea biroi]
MSFGSSYFTLLRATMIGLSAQAPLAGKRSREASSRKSNVQPRRTSRPGDAEQCRWRLARRYRPPLATERGGECREERRERRKSGPLKGRKERKEEGERQRKSSAVSERRKERRRKDEVEEDEQEGPLGIVRGRSLVTRDSCDPDDP